jgi:inner membrane transporter RhtA
VVSVQFGSSLAVRLMERVSALGVVTIRLVVAAAILAVFCRPRLRGHSRSDWGTVVAFALALAGMNGLFYQAADRMPLGPAVTLEVLGPLALSVITSRRLVSVLWAALALAGVFLLGGGDFGGIDAAGAAFALGAGVCWASYIVFSARTGRRFPQTDGLAIAMVIGALGFLPLGVADAGTDLLDPVTVGLGAGVALLSSVLPYSLELAALRRIPASAFSILMSLEPAVAALAGFLVLHQSLAPAQAVAILLVVAASMGAVRTRAKPVRPTVPDTP